MTDHETDDPKDCTDDILQALDMAWWALEHVLCQLHEHDADIWGEYICDALKALTGVDKEEIRHALDKYHIANADKQAPNGKVH